MIQQGDIVICLFPYSNLTEAKLRPALIVSNNTVNSSGDFVAVAVSTSVNNQHSIEMIGDFYSGLQRNSFVHCDKIHRINVARIKRIIAQVPIQILKQVIQKIHDYLRIEEKTP